MAGTDVVEQTMHLPPLDRLHANFFREKLENSMKGRVRTIYGAHRTAVIEEQLNVVETSAQDRVSEETLTCLGASKDAVSET